MTWETSTARRGKILLFCGSYHYRPSAELPCMFRRAHGGHLPEPFPACSQAPRKVLGLGLDVPGNGGSFLLLLEVMVSLAVFKNSILVSWSANPCPFLGHAAFH